MKKKATIQGKLMRMVMLICGSVLLLTSTAFFAYEYITYRDLARNKLETLGRILASNSTSSLAFDDAEDAREILSALRSEPQILGAVLYNKDGKMFTTYLNKLDAKEIPKGVSFTGYRFNAQYLEGFEPVIQGEKTLGTLYLRSDMKSIYDRFLLYGFIALCFIVLSFLFAYLLSRQMQRSISQPILSLAQTARVISTRKDYSVRVPHHANDDEVGELTVAFNQMLAQIQQQNNEIVTLNTNLEERIGRRTLELQNLNAVLTEQNEFTQTIIDSSVDLIAVFDEQLHYVAINNQAAKTYNRRKEDLLGKHLLEAFPTLQGKPIVEQLQRAFRGELLHISAYQSQLSNHYLENFFIPLRNKDNHVDRVLLVGHDITSIMEANEKLRQLNADLEKSNRDLEQFAYVASHDLQEPLRKIRTFSELSEQNAEKPEILRRYLSKIRSSAGRMSDLIQAVLNYSRVSRTSGELEEVSLDHVVAQIRTDLELTIEEKRATIEVSALPHIKGNVLQMHQLFLNLFTNALKFNDGAPHISVQAVLIRAKERAGRKLPPENDWIEIVFSDNGIGFDPQYAGQLFSIFQRLHTADKYAGTGIGLALCKKIVENHNGIITVESAPGEGTSFYVYLPYSPDTVQWPQMESRQPAAGV